HSSYLSYFVPRDQTSPTPALNPTANVNQAVAAWLIHNTLSITLRSTVGHDNGEPRSRCPSHKSGQPSGQRYWTRGPLGENDCPGRPVKKSGCPAATTSSREMDSLP